MNASAVTIRRARPSDADAIAGLATQLGYSAESSAVSDRLSRVLARSDQEFLVADHEQRPVGWIHMLVSEYVEAHAFLAIRSSRLSTRLRRSSARQPPRASGRLFRTCASNCLFLWRVADVDLSEALLWPSELPRRFCSFRLP